MFVDQIETVVESFESHQIAQDAIRELKAVGFTPAQIDLVSDNESNATTYGSDHDIQAHLPVVFALTQGTLSATPRGTRSDSCLKTIDDSQLRNPHSKTGNTIVKVKAGTRADIARSVLNRFRQDCAALMS